MRMTCGILERNVEIAMDALRCPQEDLEVTHLSGGESAASRLQTFARGSVCFSSMNRRTTSMRKASRGSNAICANTRAP